MLLVAMTGFITNLLFFLVIFYELMEQPFDILDRVLSEEAHRAVEVAVAEHNTPELSPVEAMNQDEYPFWLTIREQGTDP